MSSLKSSHPDGEIKITARTLRVGEHAWFYNMKRKTVRHRLTELERATGASFQLDQYTDGSIRVERKN